MHGEVRNAYKNVVETHSKNHPRDVNGREILKEQVVRK
jgi:hypothetical protein